MAFSRDMGTCCMVLPLKLGVGLITMFVFSQSLMAIMALLTGDIRFQGNGYNMAFYRLPSTVNALGICFAFVGLLGVYDDNPWMVKLFNRFQLVKLIVAAVTMVADFWTLRKCDGWLESEEHLQASQFGSTGLEQQQNKALDMLAELHVCPWARWAYLIGFSVDFGICAYFAFKSFLYESYLYSKVPYPIDFGFERHGAEGRWQFYGVKDPRIDERHPVKLLADDAGGAPASYGSTQEALASGAGGDGLSTSMPQGRRGVVGSAVASTAGGFAAGLPAATPGNTPMAFRSIDGELRGAGHGSVPPSAQPHSQ